MRERAAFPPHSLARRIASATAGSAAAAGLLAAIISLLVANRMMRGAEDQRLTGAALTLLRELPSAGATDEALRTAANDEQKELEPSRIRVAILRSGIHVGGDASLRKTTSGACDSTSASGTNIRTCSAERGELAVITSSVDVSYGIGTTLLACFASALIATSCALLASRRSARWALAPLTRLRQSLDAVATDAPSVAKTAEDEACAEVADLRHALSSLVRRLGDALGAARQFSAEAAHELKTPLTTIRAELDLLAEESLGATEREAVERLRARITTMNTLVERLLLLATVTDTPLRDQDAVAVEDLVRDYLAHLPRDAAARITFTPAGAGMVRGDEALLSAMVENVVDNALKFSKGRVHIRLREGAEVLLEVRDNGPGLSKEARERAFEPFFRTPEARGENTEGHGIGLALVSRIASAHHGAAAFVDPPLDPIAGLDGSGACLTITLPPWKEEPALDS